MNCKIQFFALVCALGFLWGCRTIRDLTIVSRSFYQMSENGELPGISKNEKMGSVDFFEITKSARKEEWYSYVETNFGHCGRSYLAQLTNSGTVKDYVFCMDSGSPKLLGAMEVREGLWYPITNQLPQK